MTADLASGSPARWFALRSATRREAAAERGLIEQGFTVYFPVEKRWRRTPLTKVVVERPLFPGYMFVHCSPDDFRQVLSTDGAHQFVRWVTAGGELEPAPFPDVMVLSIQMDQAAGLFDHTRPTNETYIPKVGDRVKITGSQWAGRFATIVNLRAGDRRAQLELDGMGKMRLDIAHLDAA